ncbi:MAG: hypothetical protein WCT04_22940 [Planctomycetota bacterium]
MQPKGGGAQVSFIFFIDIIMAISGVMLFLIILLVLDLSTSTLTPSGARQSQQDGQSVSSETESLRGKIAALQPLIDALQNRSRSLAGMDAGKSAEALARVKDSIEKLKIDTTVRGDDHMRLEKQIQDALAENHKLEKNITEIAALKAKVENAPLKLDFSLPEDDKPKNIVLVELSDESIIVQVLHKDGAPKIFRERSQKERKTVLLKNLSAFLPNEYDVLLLIKPSAFEDADELIHAVSEKGYRTGFEPMEEERSAIRW